MGLTEGVLLGTGDGAVEGNVEGLAGLRLLPVMDGAVVGAVCSTVGNRDGYILGMEVVVTDGWIVGSVGLRLEMMLGIMEGGLVIDAEGGAVGLVGEQVGSLDGRSDGWLVDAIDGASDEDVEGVCVGATDG